MNKSTLNNESELLARLSEGSELAFTTLYNHYSERLYYNILALVKDELTSEELVQDIFSQLWKKRRTIQIQSSFGGYLFTMSRNLVFDYLKKIRREKEIYARVRAIATEHYYHVEETLLDRENIELLNQAIKSLSPQRRHAFELCKLHGYSYKEASEQMGIDMSTFKYHMTKARDGIIDYISTHRQIALPVLFLSICLDL